MKVYKVLTFKNDAQKPASEFFTKSIDVITSSLDKCDYVIVTSINLIDFD